MILRKMSWENLRRCGRARVRAGVGAVARHCGRQRRTTE